MFRLHIRKNLLTMRVVQHWNRLPGGHEITIIGSVYMFVWDGLEKVDSVLKKGWD